MNPLLQRSGRSLEELFFHKHSRKLADQIREEAERAQKKSELAAAAGLSDDILLDHLLDLGIEPNTLIAFTMMPLIEIAWADFSIEPAERTAILKAAEQHGIAKDSTAFSLLTEWLEQRPTKELRDAWRTYMVELNKNLSEGERNRMWDSIMARALHVAEAAGGFLGLTSKISAAEEAKLKELRGLFT